MSLCDITNRLPKVEESEILTKLAIECGYDRAYFDNVQGELGYRFFKGDYMHWGHAPVSFMSDLRNGEETAVEWVRKIVSADLESETYLKGPPWAMIPLIELVPILDPRYPEGSVRVLFLFSDGFCHDGLFLTRDAAVDYESGDTAVTDYVREIGASLR